jgi:hypothetical protein
MDKKIKTKNMKNKETSNPTQMIKCAFSNNVHKILEPNIEVKRSERWMQKHQEKYKFTNEQKIEMFDKIWKIHQEASNQLLNFRKDRGLKKRVKREREERGYVPKKRKKSELV